MDPIADMLIRIKNASNAGHETVVIPFSKLKFAVAKALMDKGYVTAVDKKGDKIKKTLQVTVAYQEDSKTPKIQGLQRVSKSSKRVYSGVKAIKPVLAGYGLVFLSTPKGIMTGEDAKKGHVGGEVLFKIW